MQSCCRPGMASGCGGTNLPAQGPRLRIAQAVRPFPAHDAILPRRPSGLPGSKGQRTGLGLQGFPFASTVLRMPGYAQARRFGRQTACRQAQRHGLRADKAAPETRAAEGFQDQRRHWQSQGGKQKKKEKHPAGQAEATAKARRAWTANSAADMPKQPPLIQRAPI